MTADLVFDSRRYASPLTIVLLAASLVLIGCDDPTPFPRETDDIGPSTVEKRVTITTDSIENGRILSVYRGTGDHVFILDAVPGISFDYTLRTSNTPVDVYLISTNTTGDRVKPNIEVLDVAVASAAGDRFSPAGAPFDSIAPERTQVGPGLHAEPRRPLTREASPQSRPKVARSQQAARVGDKFTFYDGPTRHAATARSVVTDGTITAVVWVADENWESVDKAGVHEIADLFLQPGTANDIYDWVTAIFGDPWGPHDRADLIPAEYASQIHILLCDLRVGGKFSGRNNKLNYDGEAARSAERLMIYLAWRSASSGSGPGPGPLIAHEFEHMISYYQREVRRGLDSTGWGDEMAAMVTMDLVAEKVRNSGPRGIDFDDPTDGQPAWSVGLQSYNLCNDESITAPNYEVAYALGAYLARNYGGAALFRDFVQSEHDGIVEALEGALRSQGHAVSFGDVLRNWGIATLLSDNTATPQPYRYNSGTWSRSHAGGIDFRLGSINLFQRDPTLVAGSHLDFHKRPTYDSNRPCGQEVLAGIRNPDIWHGSPHLYTVGRFNGRLQLPYSNRYVALGRTSSDVRVRLTTDVGNRITVVVKESR